MTDLVTTGPEILTLRWGHLTEERDGRIEREVYPERSHQEPRGYLHGGVTASLLVGAARLTDLGPGEIGSLSVSLRRPTPLGVPLVVAVEPGDDGTHRVEVQHVLPTDTEEDAVETTVQGTVETGGRRPAPDLADVRQLAIAPVPEPEEHELFAGCYVCGQDNPEGIQLLPGWHTEGRVITSFFPDERYVEGQRKGTLSPIVVPALLSCPTLWACRHQLDELGLPGALLAEYEVNLHEDVNVSTALRTVGFEGEPDGEKLRGVSALVDEDGRVYATAYATWVAVEEVPEREPTRPAPADEFMPDKGGRAERSPEDWGEPLPGRREAPGARSQRPDDGADMGIRHGYPDYPADRERE